MSRGPIQQQWKWWSLLSFLFNCSQVNTLLLYQFTLSQTVTMKKTVLFPQKWKRCYCAECQSTFEIHLAMSCGVCTSFICEVSNFVLSPVFADACTQCVWARDWLLWIVMWPPLLTALWTDSCWGLPNTEACDCGCFYWWYKNSH